MRRFMIMVLVMVMFVALTAGPAAASWHETGGSISCWQLLTTYVRSANLRHWHWQGSWAAYPLNPTPYQYSTTMWQSGAQSVTNTGLGDSGTDDSGFDYAGSYPTCWH